MHTRMLIVLLVAIPLAAFGGTGDPIYVTSADGLNLLEQSRYKGDYWRLSTTLVTQQTQTMCSIASSVTVLNALPGEKPTAAVYHPYAFYTQDNFFNQQVNEVAPMQQILSRGMTLAQIADSLRANGAKVAPVLASESTVDEFRDLVKADLKDARAYIIVNFLRTEVGQEGGGHFSPIAAYHRRSDRVLILDVARYKYPPAWVLLEDLFRSMNTVDSDSGTSRGWIGVSSP